MDASDSWRTRRLRPLWAGALLALAAVAVYAPIWSAPFIFDDLPAVLDNPTLRHLWPLSVPLSPPHGRGLTVEGRPLLNLTLAVNYAISGDAVWSYHALNLLIHALAGWALFGIVRRTICFNPRGGWIHARDPQRNAAAPTLIALAVALLWTVHPLQTEAVTYIVQRAESMMGLFYLLTLYCFIRYADPDAARPSSPWAGLSVICCLLGMATKEVMVSAPLLVLLYDRTFVAGDFSSAWRRRWRYYLSLAATWLLLLALVLHTGNRGDNSGFGTGVSPWAYWLTQPSAIVRYLKLSFWPHPLVFDYATYWIEDPVRVLPPAGLVLLLLVATVTALVRWPAWGFLGAWFFAVLAPTSLVPGTVQMMAEHRMYLALAPVLAAAVWALTLLALRLRATTGLNVGLILVAAALDILTLRRNGVYASALTLWSDTVAKSPGNARAQANLAVELAKLPGRMPEALAHFQTALQLDPKAEAARLDYADTLVSLPGRHSEALALYESLVRLNPRFAGAHNNLAHALESIPGRLPEALQHYAIAIQLDPYLVQAEYNLATALMNLPGRQAEAVPHFERAIWLKPDLAAAHVNLANVLATLPGRLDEAVRHDETALRMEPDNPATQFNLAVLYARKGLIDDAIVHFQATLKLRPDFPQARDDLNQLLEVKKF